jgi:hypothetical protein
MRARSFNLWLAALAAGAGLTAALLSGPESAAQPPPSGPPTAEVPADPAPQKGVEVLTRGPVHEAFATPTDEPQPTTAVSKKPPAPLEEMPPEQKPEGNSIWIGGYWAWDEDRNDYLWVSGIWRTPPPNKRWVAGYWREDGDKNQWVPGFWAEAQKEAEKHDVTYLPKPPEAPATADAGAPPAADSFFVPGQYVWTGERYAWRAGYWGKVQPGYVWVPAHFRWTPYGYIYIGGYWDVAVAQRGVLYAPVVIDPTVVTVGYVYTPTYVVPGTVVVDAFFVRPCYCHYYYGDYYGPVYHDRGFECAVVYSRRHYDSVIVYERWEHRSDPRWETVQINVYNDRCAGRVACPPRTLALQVRSGREVIVPAAHYAPPGVKMARLEAAERTRVREEAHAIHQVAVERRAAEAKMPVGHPTQPRTASVAIPHNYPAAPRPAARTQVPTGHAGGTSPPPGRGATTPQPPGRGTTTPPPPGHPGQPGTTPPGKTPVKPPPGKPTPPAHQPPSKDPPKKDSHNDR